jgi:hypothetical protein
MLPLSRAVEKLERNRLMYMHRRSGVVSSLARSAGKEAILSYSPSPVLSLTPSPALSLPLPLLSEKYVDRALDSSRSSAQVCLYVYLCVCTHLCTHLYLYVYDCVRLVNLYTTLSDLAGQNARFCNMSQDWHKCELIDLKYSTSVALEASAFSPASVGLVRMYAYMYICLYIYTYIHQYICIYICIHVHVYIRMHIHVRNIQYEMSKQSGHVIHDLEILKSHLPEPANRLSSPLVSRRQGMWDVSSNRSPYRLHMWVYGALAVAENLTVWIGGSADFREFHILCYYIHVSCYAFIFRVTYSYFVLYIHISYCIFAFGITCSTATLLAHRLCLPCVS